MVATFEKPFIVDVLRIADDGIGAGKAQVIGVCREPGGWFKASVSKFLVIAEDGKMGWTDISNCTTEGGKFLPA